MRAYLAPTETFVYNQIAGLRRYRPVIAAHHRRAANDLPLITGAIADESLSAPLAAAERAAYRALRFALPPSIRVLERYLRAEDTRLVHYHYATDARFLLGLKMRLDVPSVVSAYGYDVSSFPRMWHGLGLRYLRAAFDHFDWFLAMSDDMREDLVALGCPESKIRIHYYGSDTRRFRHPSRCYEPERRVTVLCCGRLEEAKGQRDVLIALRRVERRRRDRFRVVLVGDGSMRTELERLVAEYGWRDRVSFHGHVPYTSRELIHHFHEADVFAHPSVTVGGLKEGIPGTIVEAMAAGLPVVATRHAGIPAVIDDGQDGVLVPERDPDTLAAALEQLLTDGSVRERLGRAAALRASRDLDLVPRTVALEDMYDDVLSGGTRGCRAEAVPAIPVTHLTVTDRP
jgi:colanic acid/amylovoran biosynthesis glycosyltransferase